MLVTEGILALVFLGDLIFLFQLLMSSGGWSIGSAYTLEFLLSGVVICLPCIFFLFLSVISILKKSKEKHKFAITILGTGIILSEILISVFMIFVKPLTVSSYIFIIPFVIFLLPLIFLLFDRKNFKQLHF